MPIDPAIANYGEQIFAKIPSYEQQQAAQADLQSKNMQLQVQREALAEHQRSLGEAQRAAALRQQVGQQYASGDVSGGRQTAMQGGDFDLVSKLDSMDDASRKRAFDISQHTAPLLLSLKNVPIEQTAQAMQSLAPQLQAAGFSPDHIAQVTQQLIDPTKRDAAFNGILTSAQTIADYTKLNADNTKQGLESDKLAETKRHNLADEKNAAAGHRLAAGLLPDDNSSDGGIPTSGADAVYGFGKYAKPPAPISSMPMGQVQQFQRELINATRGKIGAFDKSGKPLGTGAVGSYQIVGGTLAKYAPQVFGQNWQNVPFTAENQDRLGAAIWNDAKNGDLHDVWSSMPHNAPGQYANTPWEQIRGKIAQGESGGLTGGGKTGGGIIPGGKLDKKASILTPEEVASYGLPDGVYQRDGEGKITPIANSKGNPNKGSQAYSQSAMDSFDRAISSGKTLLNHPGLSAAVGAKGITGGLLGGWVMPGTDAADFATQLDTMKAQVFLPMVQSMKGLGALSNAEGAKLTASIGNLDAKQSEVSFKRNLQNIIDDLNGYKARASAGSGYGGKPSAQQGKPSGQPIKMKWGG